MFKIKVKQQSGGYVGYWGLKMHKGYAFYSSKIVATTPEDAKYFAQREIDYWKLQNA